MKGLQAALVLALFAAALDAAAPPRTDTSRVEVVLKKWDAARQAERWSHYMFTQTSSWYDVFAERRVKTVLRGEVFIGWPDRLLVEIRTEAGDRHLVALFTGDTARVWLFDSKREYVFHLPEGRRLPEAAARCPGRGTTLARVIEDPLWAVLGPPARGFSGRFTPSLEKEDGRAVVLRLEPRETSGWVWMPDEAWRVVLNKADHSLLAVSTPHLKTEFGRPDHKPLPASAWRPPFEKLPKGWARVELGTYPATDGE